MGNLRRKWHLSTLFSKLLKATHKDQKGGFYNERNITENGAGRP